MQEYLPQGGLGYTEVSCARPAPCLLGHSGSLSVFAEQKIYVLPALAASLLFGFGIEWVYLPLIILWLAWLGYDVWKWRKL